LNPPAIPYEPLQWPEEPTVESLHWPELTAQQLQADVLRLDRLHPVLSGNKWFKLHHHLQLAGRSPLLTFGGAWSNHLVATAFAAAHAGLPVIGIIRGERPATLSATLQEAAGYGMQLEFISREEYAQKTQPALLQQWSHRYPGAYIIPEGGGGLPGIIGSETILSKTNAASYTHILCAIGTGTTWLGLVRASHPGQFVIGVPMLKGLEDPSAIDPDGLLTPEQTSRAHLLTGYHFGGYARHPQPLLDFMNDLYTHSHIPTDIVYTGKLFYAVYDNLRSHFFPAHSRLLIIHSGGLQGNRSLAPGQLLF
jgi:1-aminocyclopropane-1-carboxylate deaminase/D-cysteine desulfhydrase-like pyridoxal-dependent ACC family enzyme